MNIEELKRLAEAAIKAGKTGTYKEFAIARTAFGSVANPAAVLELIAEVERAESAEAELLAVREDNHSMILEIDGLRTERDRLAAELQKLREQKPIGEVIEKAIIGSTITYYDNELVCSLPIGTKIYTDHIPAPAVPVGASLAPPGGNCVCGEVVLACTERA